MAKPKTLAPRVPKTRQRARKSTGPPWYHSSSGRSILAFGALAVILVLAFRILFSPTSSVESKPLTRTASPAKRSWRRTGQGVVRGIVATENISPGSLIILDTALIGIPSDANRTTATETLLAEIERLPQSAKNDFFNLPFTPARLPEDYTPDALALNIFESNAVRSGETSSVFRNACYISHSCSPNANFFYRDDLGALVVQALRNIKAGEEITCPYFNAAVHTRDERQEFFIKSRGSTCECPICSLEGEALEDSDKRRSRLSEIEAMLTEWSEEKIEPEEVLAAIEEAYELLKAEDYSANLGSWAANAMSIAASHSDADTTKKWALVAAVHYAREAGQDSPQVSAISKIYEDPKNAAAWGKRDDPRSFN